MSTTPTSEPLKVGRFRVPAEELSWTFATSGGPGGQHANRSQTKAELRFDLANSHTFPEELKTLMLARLPNSDGVVTVEAAETRSQWRNRQKARSKLVSLLERSMREPKVRRSTKPTKASVEQRLQQKRNRSKIKADRKRVDE